MAFLSNMHTHSTYSDGDSTLEEYVQTALDLGFVSLGFSEHAPTTYCPCEIPPHRVPDYLREVRKLGRKYKNRIELYAGMEYDVFEWVDYHDFSMDRYFRRNTYRLDYLIGAVHYLKLSDGTRASIDFTPERTEDIIRDYGGAQATAREYYRLVCDVATRLKPDVLAHFDLLTKFNSNNRLFDEDSVWYREIVDDAVVQVAKSGVTVEVNTGAMARGYRDVPYPSEYILRGLFARGVPVTISSDAHNADNLNFGFEHAAALLRHVGYRTVKQYIGGVFADIPL
ncbi:MAG: histidinol-phosphatase [Oscillospiraceae bacterium]|nr:histidinol-phosphatase [Oscillospiraceae bacterium]